MDPDGEDEKRDRSPERECERVAEDFRNGLVPPPAILDQAREEVARPCRQEGNDRGRPEIRERDRGDRMLDEGRPPETVGTLSPGLPIETMRLDGNLAVKDRAGPVPSYLNLCIPVARHYVLKGVRGVR